MRTLAEKAKGKAEDLVTLLDRLLEEGGEATRLLARIDELERTLASDTLGWSAPYPVEDTPGLPVPRLELLWHKEGETWGRYTFEYRLVATHLLGHAVARPLGRTQGHASGYLDDWMPWRCKGRVELREHDVAHAFHDAAHLGLPLYAILPDDGPLRLDDHPVHRATYHHQRAMGVQHTRKAAAAPSPAVDACPEGCPHDGFHYCTNGTHCDVHCTCPCRLCTQERAGAQDRPSTSGDPAP